MQPPEEPRTIESAPARVRPWLAIAAAALSLVLISGVVAYVLATSRTRTTTVIKTVATKTSKAPATTALSCVPGAAAGSCTIDEARALAIPDQPLSPATRALLASQLVAARAAALRYPTVADARHQSGT
jgi:hypothetical protein